MRKHVLFSCHALQHTEVAETLAKALREDGLSSGLLWNGIHPLDSIAQVFDFWTEDARALPGLLKDVGLVVFFHNETAPQCLNAIKLGQLAKACNTARITIQHGWIQPGLNFFGDNRKVAFEGRDSSAAKALHNFSDVIQYFGAEGIGYPLLSHAESISTTLPRRANILVGTNFNWGVYPWEHVAAFISGIEALKAEHPSFRFIHKPHAAESQSGVAHSVGKDLQALGINSCAWPDLGSALAWADAVITTPSTLALDALAQKTPAVVFTPPVFKNAVSEFGFPSYFRKDELRNVITRSLIGEHPQMSSVPPFAPLRFTARAKDQLQRSGPFVLDEATYLSYMASVGA